MSTDMTPAQATPKPPSIAQPRLPYHPALQDRFGIGITEWRALVESTFPAAKTVGAVILALAYCKSRNLDPFKKTVHIVPIWDNQRRCEVETVWPGIAEYRTTAARTGSYAGHDEATHGPMVEETWDDKDGPVTVRFPEWSQITVYRIVQCQRCAFPGPKVYWMETYAHKKNKCPNSMWAQRPIGMLDKCAEAAALRGAFPEEYGGEPTFEEWGGFRWHGRAAIDAESSTVTTPKIEGPRTQQPSETADTTQDAPEPEATEQPPVEAEAAPAAAEEPEGEYTDPTPLEEWLGTMVATITTAKEVAYAREQLAEDTTLNDQERAVVAEAIDKKAKGLKGKS